MIGGVGQRMLTGVAKKTAGEFFSTVDDYLNGTLPAAGRAPAPSRQRAALSTAGRHRLSSRRRVQPRRWPPRRAATSPRARSSARWRPWSVPSSEGCSPVAGADHDLTCYSTARAMVAAVKARQISARELLDLHLDRIDATNPQVNAVVSLDVERARAGAAEADEATASGAETGPLHGLPFAFKDTHEVGGWRTTFGSPLKADFVPERDELIVERVRGAGVVPIGKTNVPEWAAGSHTFNPIFGTTLNPYDLTRSAGGSSGGAAAALGIRDGAARRRQRHGRLAAQPGVVLQRRRAAAERRPSARVAELERLAAAVGRRPDGPQRRGPGAAAVGPGRAELARTARPGVTRSRVRPADRSPAR